MPKVLGLLASLHKASGSGPISSGHRLLNVNANTLGVHGTRPHRILWERKAGQNCTVSSALTAVGQTIALACNNNPTKINRSDKLLPRLQIMLDGYGKEDLKLPVQADVPELLVSTAYQGGGMEMDKAATDLTMIAFYYLL